MNHHNIRFTGADTYFGLGTIVSPNEFLGTINIYSTTYIEGDLIVTDTLQNKSGGHYSLYVNGNIENNGVIQKNTSGNLYLYISGDIANNGKWENTSTYLNGSGQQLISQMAGKSFGSSFNNSNSTDTIRATTDLSFTSTFILNNNILD